MFYLADFKRRYEKELFVTDEKGKPKYNYFRSGNQRRKRNSTIGDSLEGRNLIAQGRDTKLATVRSQVLNARKLENEYGQLGNNKNVLGRYKYSEKELENRKQQLRAITGGYDDKKPPLPTARQKKLARKLEENKKRLAEIKRQKDIKEVTSDLWEEVKVEKLPKTKTEKPPQKLLTASNRPPVNLPKKDRIKIVSNDFKINLPEETTVVKPKKVSRKLGRKVLLGLGAISAIGGIGYGIDKLRKTRSDKNKKRGKYKK